MRLARRYVLRHPKKGRKPLFKIPVYVTIGAILGWLLDRWMSGQAWRQQALIEGVVSSQDVIELGIGAGLLFFGGRIHSSLKWVGLGIFSYEVSRIVAEQVFKTGVM